MGMKKTKSRAIKEMLFTYLAISKIFYWYNTINALSLSDAGRVGEAVLGRFLEQDFLIIASIVVFFYLERMITFRKSKYSKVWENILFYGVSYVILIGMIIGYNVALNLILTGTAVFPRNWGAFFGNTFVLYAMIMSILNFKEYLKRKEKAIYANEPSTRNVEEKLSMLKALLEDGVLTQAEFDHKKKLV